MYTDDSGAITAILQGDRDRYEELVAKYKRMVYGIAWSHLGDRDLSEDVAQETFVTAFRHLGTLRKHDHFPGWLAQIARNVCNTFGRKAQREQALAERWMLESDAAQAQEADRRSLEEQLRDAFTELPAIHREALTVFYLEEKSIRESAAVLGISETALKARLHRARLALREQLERRLDETLESLEPSPHFTRKVLSALPLMPNGALGGGGIAAIAGKFIAGLGFVLWMTLAQVGFLTAFVVWFTKSEAANIRDTPQNQFRKMAIRRIGIGLGVAVAIGWLSAAGVYIAAAHGPSPNAAGLRAFFRIMACLYAVLGWRHVRWLRVNTHPVTLSNAFSALIYFLSVAAIGFLNVPFGILAVAMLIGNVVAFLAYRNRPNRQDYSLFLRAATGGLGQVSEDAESLPNRLTQAQLREFARFLGEQWLVEDYSLRADAIHLLVPGLRTSIGRALGIGSSITIGSDGTCSAHIAPADLKGVRQTAGPNLDAENLQKTVCQVVRYALRCFVQGDLDAARSVLTAQDDESIFEHNVGWTKGFVALFVLAIICSIYMVLQLWSKLPW